MNRHLSLIALAAAVVCSCGGGGHQVGVDGGAGTGAAGVGAAGTVGNATGSAGTNASVAGADGNDAADGPPAAPLPDFADGTRLKALAYVTGDGHKLWHGWRDTQRQEPCTFQIASDGKLRCLPQFESAPYFADDKCTKPLMLRVPCSGPGPAYAAQGSYGACTDKGPLLFKMVQKVATPARLYFDAGGGQCLGDEEAYTGPNEVWVADAVPEPATAFVAAQEVRDDRGPLLMARYYKADDGALQLLGAYDRAGQRACDEPPRMPGICAPKPLTSVSFTKEFADPACMVRTALVNSPCFAPGSQPPQIVAMASGGSACLGPDTSAKFYRVGEKYPERPYTMMGGACARSTSPRMFTASSSRHYLGDEVPASTFPPVKTLDEGATRFKVRTLETPDGQHLMPKQIVDSELGGTCTPTLVGATLRCLPDQRVGDPLFIDAACTQRVYVGGGACSTSKFVMLGGSIACQGAAAMPTRYFEVGGVVTPAKLFLGFGDGTCIEYPVLGEVHTLTEHPLEDAPPIAGD